VKLQKSGHPPPPPPAREPGHLTSRRSDNDEPTSPTPLQDVFQCLAQLGDSAIVSQPAKLIVGELHPFEPQDDVNVTTVAGNTAVIPCQLPRSIPFAVAEFEFNNSFIIFDTGNWRITRPWFRI